MGECCAHEALIKDGKISAEGREETGKETWAKVRYGNYGLDEKSAVAALCATCSRPLVVELKRGSCLAHNRDYFCSERCRWTHDNRLRSERRAARCVKVCPVCGQEFTATRRDAKTCSPACRQKMYCQRRSRAE